ncbi:MAG: PilZ domain-containing protein [Thermodesulfobacteriota bacterium]|nr:PilZ domain-containing protein [Thermodesulfobacteriota bacterium]
MPDAERIEGKGRLEIIRNLQAKKTLVSLRILGQDYSRLSMITDIRIRDKVHYFSIDYPKGFGEAIANVDVWKIHFEFRGDDKVSYIFRTVGGEISGKKIWIRFPGFIEREQRRKHFRIEPPPGSVLHFLKDDNRLKMSMINLGLGGVLVFLKKKIEKSPMLMPGDDLRDIELVFPPEGVGLKVKIKKAMVVWSGKDPLTNRYRYGLKFTETEKSEERALTSVIYEFQRDFLLKRSRVYE